ncbi:hypothetical protein HOG17_05345 [Candidatus Peregrinibacteria bacterium]|jgi:hypothetical protein|nr:hypothetical protein [Candidatus Peregrinibacteria bacterium]MBT4148172.1 hypothetical protein [Candidatus Peregrinibacteria bacterium]MBT4365883.1 hypothetical protein [Candidatus Peregrinibacteria bacterium]MBT4455646.1 hypothetical protein [Candidatus Peregrinibacteria bacterium]
MDFEIEKLGETVQIVEGGPDQEISEEDLDTLTWQLMTSYFPNDKLDPNNLDEPKDLRGCFDRDKGHIAEYIKNPDCVLAKDGDRIVGLSMLKQQDVSTPDGRPYVMYTISSLLPKYRGTGLYKEMYKRKEDSCREKFPNAVVVIMTRTPAVKKTALKHGFREIPHSEWQDRMGEPRNRKHSASIEKDGWVCFLRDDQEKQGAGQISSTTSSLRGRVGGLLGRFFKN